MVATRRKQVVELTRKETVLPELERIRIENGGLLIAEQVVEVAKDEDNPLHKYFQWDDTEAAHAYRLSQARQLISAMVTLIPNVKRPVVAYVSLRADRQYPEGGYHALVDVLSDREQREELLSEALDDLRTWERKYKILNELSIIFEAANKVRFRKTKQVV